MRAIATVVTAARHSSSGLATSRGTMTTPPSPFATTSAPGGWSQPTITIWPTTSEPGHDRGRAELAREGVHVGLGVQLRRGLLRLSARTRHGDQGQHLRPVD